jgi:YidC/Oxa1 family membrane protein insertase
MNVSTTKMVNFLTRLTVMVGIFMVTYWLTATITNYFWPSVPKDQIESTFIAPDARQVADPINTTIEFSESKRSGSVVLTDVETAWGSLTFSTQGASLERLMFKKNKGGSTHELTTIFPVTESERENRCFLVALPSNTPYFYTLTSHEKLQGYDRLVYEASSHIGTIKKTFVVFHDLYKIDLLLELECAQQEIEPTAVRLQFPSPILPAMAKYDQIAAIVEDRKGIFEKINSVKLDQKRGWFSPSLFGTDSRYFVHAMIADKNQFVGRAYYKVVEKNYLISMLESVPVTRSGSWQFSFYCGPKIECSLLAVDPRLENTLDYSGILFPISQFLLMILNMLYGYLGSYGWAIIVLTILMRLLLVPFTWRSERNSKKAKELQSKMAYVQARYKNDPETAKREQAALIAKYGMPGFASMLPLLLIQLPIFLAMNRLLGSSIELYNSGFLWMKDLAAPDPYYILPLLVTVTMLVHAATIDAQQRTMMIVLGFVLGAFATTWSAGLLIFIMVGTLLGVAQAMIAKKIG